MSDSSNLRYEVYAWGPTTPSDHGLIAALFDNRDEAMACADKLTGKRLHNRRAEVRDVVSEQVIYRSDREEGFAGFVYAADDWLRPRVRVSDLAERGGSWNPSLNR